MPSPNAQARPRPEDDLQPQSLHPQAHERDRRHVKVLSASDARVPLRSPRNEDPLAAK